MTLSKARNLYPQNPILVVCHQLEYRIETEGVEHENTKELVGQHLSLLTKHDPEDITYYVPSLLNLEMQVADYYGDKWIPRLTDEKYHYKQLEYSLLHKVKELAYFFKAPVENRKTIVFSQDCISSVQYIKRADRSMLLVHMRSSDVLSLLPMDLLALAKIQNRLNTEYATEVKMESLEVFLGSAHIYLSGGRE